MVVQPPRSPAGRAAPAPGPLDLHAAITPGRHLVVRAIEAGETAGGAIAPEAAARIAAAFAAGPGEGLLQLGASEVTAPLPPALAYWRDLAARYMAAVCARGEDASAPIA